MTYMLVFLIVDYLLDCLLNQEDYELNQEDYELKEEVIAWLQANKLLEEKEYYENGL